LNPYQPPGIVLPLTTTGDSDGQAPSANHITNMNRRFIANVALFSGFSEVARIDFYQGQAGRPHHIEAQMSKNKKSRQNYSHMA
jgi:hypothetical protein